MEIFEKAEQFVSNLLKDKLSASYTYHNFKHTQRVVKAAKILADAEKVSDGEKAALVLAAWFHDTGYVLGAQNHEEKSVSIFREFLNENTVADETVALVESLIRITEMRREPTTVPEKIIRDADCSHFGKEDFESISASLRKEWEITQQKIYTDREWFLGNLEMLTKWHQYQTEYALNSWQPQKEKNVQSMKEKIQTDIPDSETKEKKKGKKDKPDRGVETMFRVTLNNHTQLSQIADSKANILLSVNAIIISIALSTLIPKLDSPSNAHLMLPTFTLLLFSVISIIFAILATRPKVNSYNYTKKDIENRKVNLLFFGNFYKMPLDDYQSAMKDLMQDRDYLYESLIRDLYLLGKVLHRKYKLLRITYNVFMFGIIASVIAFVVAFNSI